MADNNHILSITWYNKKYVMFSEKRFLSNLGEEI